MYIIAGLGNPGREYENTRHNAGFASLDALAKRHGIELTTRKFQALTGSGYIDGQKVLLVKPQTYMNLSGESLRAACDFFKVDPEEGLIVIYDDISLAPGRLVHKDQVTRQAQQYKETSFAPLHQVFCRVKVGGVRTRQAGIWRIMCWGISQRRSRCSWRSLRAADAASALLTEDVERVMNQYNTHK